MVFVTGGSGFVGGHLVKRLRDEERPVRCLVRSGRSDFLSGLGAEVVKGDVLDPIGLAEAMGGCSAVVHLAGVWRAGLSQYRRLHIQGTANVAEAARLARVKRFVYTSAMGVTLNIDTGFYRTKGASEKAVKESGLDYVIFRPAVIIGPGDEFTTALTDMVKKSPVLLVPGDGRVRFSPLWVGDLVECLVKALDSERVVNRTYDIAGPDRFSYDDLLDVLMGALSLSRPKVHMPLSLLSPMVRLGEALVPGLPISSDELKIMERDNLCDVSAAVKAFGLKQTPFSVAVRQYLSGK